MKKKALLIASLTVISMAAQNQPGQSTQTQSQQSQPGQSQQSSQSQKDQQAQQASQGKPGESQSSSATSRPPGQSASGAAGQSQSGQSSQGQFQSAQGSNLQQFIDYKVVDKQEKQIGKVEALWEDQSGQPAFLAIKPQQQGQQSQQSQDQLLVVPAQSAEVNKSIRTVRVPYNQQILQNAPKLKSEDELDAQAQSRITAFYRQHGYQPRAQQQSSATQRSGQDQASITLKEESVNIGTREVDAGGVLLKKIVRTDTVSKPVELQSESIVIERVEGTGRPVQGEVGSFQEQQIYIPLRREVPVVGKEVQVKERINVGKETDTERRKISEQVREEDLQIIKEQGTDVQIEGQQPGQSEQRNRQQQKEEQEEQ